MTTADADESALVDNTVADAFLEAATRARSENVERSAEALDPRPDHLRDQLQAKEEAVER